MRPAILFQLLLLGAIWGGSFIFMRILAPVFGPVLAVFLRVGIAGLALLVYFQFIGFKMHWRKHGRHYIAIGIINAAIPFLLYAYAALHIPAALSAILNSSAPLFGTLLGALWLNERITLRKLGGILLGFLGVSLVALKGAPLHMGDQGLWGAIACVVAALCYGLSGVYLKKFASHIPSQAIAAGSPTVAALCLLPFTIGSSVHGEWWTPQVMGSLAGISLVCSAAAFVIYYRIVAEVGPSRALTVTFLMPIFGTLWAAVFLGERITAQMIAGCAMILCGTLLVVRVPVSKDKRAIEPIPT